MSNTQKYIPEITNVKINQNTIPASCTKANIVEIQNIPSFDIQNNRLNITVRLYYLDPAADAENPLNYRLIKSEKLEIDATNIFSLGCLINTIETTYLLSSTTNEWNALNKYNIFETVSYKSANYLSIVDLNTNNKPIGSTASSDAWIPYYDNTIKYTTDNLVYYPYTYTYIGPIECTGSTGTTGATGFYYPPGYAGPTGMFNNINPFPYICTQDSIGNTPPAPNSSSSYWQLYVWNSEIEYDLNAQTTYYSKNYISNISSNKNNNPTNNPNYWTEIWSSLVTYYIYDIVKYINVPYMSITTNINNTPSSSSEYWVKQWTTENLYNQGEYVYYQVPDTSIFNVFISIVNANQGNNPSGNPTYWKPYIWLGDYNYKDNDIVLYYQYLYMNINIKVNNTNKQPDISNQYWAIKYDIKEIYNISDMVYYDNTVYMSLINLNIYTPSYTLPNSKYWTTKFTDRTYYLPGDFVYYTDFVIYKCKTATDGTQNPGTSFSYWQPYIWNTSVISPCPAYNFTANSTFGDIIYYTNKSQLYIQSDFTNINTVYKNYTSYLCAISGLNQIPSISSVYWASKWNNQILYYTGYKVYYNDPESVYYGVNFLYISLKDGNINKNPADDKEFWASI